MTPWRRRTAAPRPPEAGPTSSGTPGDAVRGACELSSRLHLSCPRQAIAPQGCAPCVLAHEGRDGSAVCTISLCHLPIVSSVSPTLGTLTNDLNASLQCHTH